MLLFRLLFPLLVRISFSAFQVEALGNEILPGIAALVHALEQSNDSDGRRWLRGSDNITSHSELDMLKNVLQESLDEEELAVLEKTGAPAKEVRSLLWLENPWCFLDVFNGVFNNFYKESDLGNDLVRRKDYNTIRTNGRDMVDIMRVHNVGPLSLQGVFWLNVKPEEGISELFSLAEASAQGGGLSSGELSETDPVYRVRALGDKVRNRMLLAFVGSALR